MYLLELEIVEKGKLTKQEFVLSGTTKVLVGRLDCDLTLPDRQVSRKHMSFRVREERLIAADLGSRAGTYLNGQPMKQTYARKGDVFQVGTYLIRVRGFTVSKRREPEMDFGMSAQAATSTFQIPLIGPDGLMTRALRRLAEASTLKRAFVLGALGLVLVGALRLAQKPETPSRGIASVQQASASR